VDAVLVDFRPAPGVEQGVELERKSHAAAWQRVQLAKPQAEILVGLDDVELVVLPNAMVDRLLAAMHMEVERFAFGAVADGDLPGGAPVLLLVVLERDGVAEELAEGFGQGGAGCVVRLGRGGESR
jgi:hypothetical protein